MSQQKRSALLSMQETDTPFRPTHTQTVFKNTANLQLRGKTYDATHMDKFLGSEFGESRIMENARDTNDQSNIYNQSLVSAHASAMAPQNNPAAQGGSYVTNSQAIKPTTSFMTLKRDQIKMDTYVDLHDGPSFLQKR